MKSLLEFLGWILVAIVAAHWLSSGAEDIVEGSLEVPEHSLRQIDN